MHRGVHGAQAGLSPQLRTLVDLEALVNDGSAFVCFELLRVSAARPVHCLLQLARVTLARRVSEHDIFARVVQQYMLGLRFHKASQRHLNMLLYS